MTEVPDDTAKNLAQEVRAELHSEPASKLRAELRTWCEAWNTCLQNVLSQIFGRPTDFELSSDPLPVAASDVWYTIVAGGAVRGEMTLRLPADSGGRLARKFLGETDVDSASAAATSTAEQVSAEQIAPDQ